MCVTAKDAKTLNLLEAENKLAALPTSSCLSKWRFLFTTALLAVLLKDNTLGIQKHFL